MRQFEQTYSFYPSKPYSKNQFSTSPGGVEIVQLPFFLVTNIQHNSNINSAPSKKNIYLKYIYT